MDAWGLLKRDLMLHLTDWNSHKTKPCKRYQMVLTLHRLKHYLKYLMLDHNARFYHRQHSRATAVLKNINERASSSTDKMFLSPKTKITSPWKKLKASCRLKMATKAFLYGEIKGVGFSFSMFCYLKSWSLCWHRTYIYI